MSNWCLSKLLAGLHDDMQHRLANSRKLFAHPDSKGDASENVWLELLQKYLPQRYQAAKAFVVDSKNTFSEQQDIVIFDRQYSPFILDYEEQKIIPAESVYAVFEVKQVINKSFIDYAQEKIASVRRLYRTSLPIPHAGGTYPAKILTPILGGILTFESDWNPPLGTPLLEALNLRDDNHHIDLGCIAAHGTFAYNKLTKIYDIFPKGKPATAFLFNLISILQNNATVPMIDINAYASWLES